MFVNINVNFAFCAVNLLNALATSGSAEGEDAERARFKGKLARAGQFPFAIRLYSRLGEEAVTYCTAAIIRNDKLLTAGHCCYVTASRFVVAGDPDQTDFVFHSNPVKYRVHAVKKVLIHPKFEWSEVKLVYDLCLLFLEEPLRPDDAHGLIEIEYDKMAGKKNCTALGWGSNLGYKIQHKLYYKEGIAYRCNLRFGNSSKYWFVCLEPHSVCPGDSGGPLLCDGKLHGIASFFIGHAKDSHAKCEKGVVDYYTELWSEREFIERSLDRGHPSVPSPRLAAAAVLLHLLPNRVPFDL